MPLIYHAPAGRDLKSFSTTDAMKAQLGLIDSNERRRFEDARNYRERQGLIPKRVDVEARDTSFLSELDLLHSPRLEHTNSKFDVWFNHDENFKSEYLIDAVIPAFYGLSGLAWLSSAVKGRLADESSICLNRALCLNRVSLDGEDKRFLLEDLVERLSILKVAVVRSGGMNQDGDTSELDSTMLLGETRSWKSQMAEEMGLDYQDVEQLTPRSNPLHIYEGEERGKAGGFNPLTKGYTRNLPVSPSWRKKIHPPQTPEKGGERKKAKNRNDDALVAIGKEASV